MGVEIRGPAPTSPETHAMSSTASRHIDRMAGVG